MNTTTFIDNFRGAFGESAPLPIAFWYSDVPLAVTEKINGCFLKGLQTVCKGQPISLYADAIGCGGGKFYAGFSEMPVHVPTFVSLKERYKQTPEQVVAFLAELGVPRASHNYLNFARIDQMENFGPAEGILFLATPDILSGLTTWAFFDNNAADAVTALFGSGCSAIVTQTVLENRTNGRRTFLGLLDPSARPYFEADLLTYVIPMSRFKEMYHTMTGSCLFDTHAWARIKERINS